METVRRVFNKLKTKLLYDAGYLSKESENGNWKRYVRACARYRIVYNSKATQVIEVPGDRWMNAEVVHITNAMLLGRKKEWNIAILTT